MEVGELSNLKAARTGQRINGEQAALSTAAILKPSFLAATEALGHFKIWNCKGFGREGGALRSSKIDLAMPQPKLFGVTALKPHLCLRPRRSRSSSIRRKRRLRGYGGKRLTIFQLSAAFRVLENFGPFARRLHLPTRTLQDLLQTDVNNFKVSWAWQLALGVAQQSSDAAYGALRSKIQEPDCLYKRP